MDDVIKVITSLGVPVTFCLMLGWFVFQIWKAQREDEKLREQAQREDANKREEKDRETITRLSGILSENSKALLKNSEVMEKISEKIDNIDDKLDGVQKDVQEIKIRQKNNNEE